MYATMLLQSLLPLSGYPMKPLAFVLLPYFTLFHPPLPFFSLTGSFVWRKIRVMPSSGAKFAEHFQNNGTSPKREERNPHRGKFFKKPLGRGRSGDEGLKPAGAVTWATWWVEKSGGDTGRVAQAMHS